MKGSIPQLWENARVFVIGGGPSVSSFDPEILKGKHVVVVNNAYKIFPEADFLYFMDCAWWKWNKKDLFGFYGLKVTTCDECEKVPGVIHLQRGARNGIDMRPTHLSRGSNSGYGAVNVGIKAGGSEIILATGFDMRTVDGKHNYHDEHQRVVPDNIYENQHLKSFKFLAAAADKMGIKIINCTPDSAMDYFPKDSLENWV